VYGCVCVCVGFVMCVYMFLCGFCNVWLYVCVGLLMYMCVDVCVCVWDL